MKQLLFFIFFTVLLTAQAKNLNSPLVEGIKNSQEGKQAAISYTFIVIPSINNTWGYDIYKNEKLLIHQTNIPGISGNEGFKKKSDAGQVARLVIDKLKKGEMPPSINKDELENLKVL